MLILSDLEDTEVMRIRVKDIDMFKEQYALGCVGPQVIASTTVQVNQEVDGYLELTPSKWLNLNGAPVIQLKVKWLRVGDTSEGLPTPGQAWALINA